MWKWWNTCFFSQCNMATHSPFPRISFACLNDEIVKSNYLIYVLYYPLVTKYVERNSITHVWKFPHKHFIKHVVPIRMRNHTNQSRVIHLLRVVDDNNDPDVAHLNQHRPKIPAKSGQKWAPHIYLLCSSFFPMLCSTNN